MCRALLNAADRPTAVLVYSENDVSVLMTVAAELRLAVPRDLSVLVFSPMELWVAGRTVSSVAVPTLEIGRRAVRMFLRKAKSPEETCPPEAVPYEAVLRNSVAPPVA